MLAGRDGRDGVMRSTTVLCVRHGGKLAMGGDGQVTLGDTVVKSTARKIRRLTPVAGVPILAGFAGATADAFTLLERFEKRLSGSRQLSRAAEELARDWRTDRILRRLQAMLIIADQKDLLVLSGMGDVLSPENNIAAIGSGAPYAESAALAMTRHAPNMTARAIVEESLRIAADICIYTNHNLTIEELEKPKKEEPKKK